jgi:hypothetical protein
MDNALAYYVSMLYKPPKCFITLSTARRKASDGMRKSMSPTKRQGYDSFFFVAKVSSKSYSVRPWRAFQSGLLLVGKARSLPLGAPLR